MRNSEQHAIAEMVRDVLADVVDLERVKAEKPLETGPGALAAAGLVDLLVDGEGTIADLAVVAEELGRAAAPSPLVELAVGRSVAQEAGLEVDGLVSAAVRTTELAWTDKTQHVVLADRDGVALHRVQSTERRSTLDLTRSYVDVSLEGSDARIDDPALAAWVLDVLDVLVLADSLGATERLLQMTVEHVTSRQQFGQVVGGFQAVKHHAADMRVALATSRAVIERAVGAVVDGSPDRGDLVAAAVVHAAPALSRSASTALQLHGGMGFTWEHDLHLYQRRITAAELRGRPVARGMSRLAGQLA